jgi:hypothetical protein
VVTTTPHADEHSVRAGEAHSRLDVCIVQTAGDQRGATIDRAIPDFARLVIPAIRRSEQAAADARRESVDLRLT